MVVVVVVLGGGPSRTDHVVAVVGSGARGVLAPDVRARPEDGRADPELIRPGRNCEGTDGETGDGREDG